jgi:hypothetical protein
VSIRVPSLCSIESGHPFIPTCLLAERRAQRHSRMPPRMRRHRRSRRKASLTERARCYPLPWRHYTTGCRAGLPPRFFCLIIGGRSSPSSGESANHRFRGSALGTQVLAIGGDLGVCINPAHGGQSAFVGREPRLSARDCAAELATLSTETSSITRLPLPASGLSTRRPGPITVPTDSIRAIMPASLDTLRLSPHPKEPNALLSQLPHDPRLTTAERRREEHHPDSSYRLAPFSGLSAGLPFGNV